MITLLDTTLRDGAQAEGVTFSLDDKHKITRALDEFGISLIEGGNPAANPKDAAYFAEQSEKPALRYAQLVAFGATAKPGIDPAHDASLQVIAACKAGTAAIFGKSSLLHVEQVLRCTPEENLRIIRESVRFLCDSGIRVIFDAEHFFDGYRLNREYSLAALQAAADGGAWCLTLCDTNGGALPEDVAAATREVCSMFPQVIGIHCHNDCGLAVACSLAAVGAGATLVQGTMNGVGERCGNADLCTLIPLLEMKLNKRCLPQGHLQMLTHTSRLIAEIMNVSHPDRAPFVGNSAFAHKGGMHIDGVIKHSATFEQIPPESVGNQRRFLVSDQAGRAGVYARLSHIIPDINRDSDEMLRVIERLKHREAQGYTYENADGSFALLALDTLGRRPKFFHVTDFHVLCHQQQNIPEADKSSQAYVKVRVNEREGINAAEGDGPVNALDIALRKTLSDFYPCLNRMRLLDFKVRVLDTGGTASTVRVSIESTDGINRWNTVGVSTNIIHACFKALIDSLDYMLIYFGDN